MGGWWDNQNAGEPGAWRGMRIFPASVGSAIIRDVRTLHGGSPNFSEAARFLPAVEFVSARFIQTPRGKGYICKGSLPREIYEKLRPATRRRVCPAVVTKSDVKVTYKAT